MLKCVTHTLATSFPRLRSWLRCSLLVPLLAACAATEAPRPITVAEQGVVDAFLVTATPEQRNIHAGQPFRLKVQVTNQSDSSQEFLTLRCDKQVNWWVNHPDLERLPVAEECPKNHLVVVNLQPGGTYEEVAVVKFQNLVPTGEQRVNVGFAPWQTVNQLKGRLDLTLPVEVASAMTVWSPSIRFVVAPPGHRTVVR